MGDPIFGGDFGYSAGDLIANPLGPGMGKPSSAQQSATTEALINATRIPMELWNTTSEMRGNVTNALNDFTAGNYDLTKSPMFAPGKAAIEDAYQTSANDIISKMPQGGTMFNELGDLSQDRARKLTDVVGRIQQDMLDKAYGAGYGTPQSSMSGLNQSAGNLSAATAAQTANAGKNAEGLGLLIGKIAAK
jgi:hypothetical protein